MPKDKPPISVQIAMEEFSDYLRNMRWVIKCERDILNEKVRELTNRFKMNPASGAPEQRE